MAWALVSVGTKAQDSGGGTATPGAPSGSGGILFLNLQGSSATPNAPSGWTEVLSQSRSRLFMRLSDGGANDTPACSTSSGVTVAQLARFSGGPATLTGIVDASAANGAPSSNDIPTAAITTPAGDGRLIIYIGGLWGSSTGPADVAYPNSSTVLGDHTISSSTNGWVVWSYTIQTTAAAVGASSFNQSGSASTAAARGVTASFVPAAPALTKYVKILADSPAASATGVEVVVYNAPSGSNYITGTTRYGSVNAQEFEASLESGSAVLKVLASDVGCDGLAVSTTVAAQARNTTYTTGMVSATIIEE